MLKLSVRKKLRLPRSTTHPRWLEDLCSEGVKYYNLYIFILCLAAQEDEPKNKTNEILRNSVAWYTVKHVCLVEFCIGSFFCFNLDIVTSKATTAPAEVSGLLDEASRAKPPAKKPRGRPPKKTVQKESKPKAKARVPKKNNEGNESNEG